MATSFETIISRTMITLRDYKLERVYENDPTLFAEVMSGYVTKGCTKFEACQKPLTYDATTQEFASDFNMHEIDVLADLAVMEWFVDNLNDVLEFKEPLQDGDFKKYSTGQNLRPRQDYLRDQRTRIKQDITNYLFYTPGIINALGEGT